MRRMLESAILRQHRELTETQAVVVWAACRAFRRAQRIEKRLRQDGKTLTADQWLAMQARATALEEAVVRHVRALGLDQAEADPYAAMRELFAAQEQPPALPAAPPDAAQGNADEPDQAEEG